METSEGMECKFQIEKVTGEELVMEVCVDLRKKLEKEFGVHQQEAHQKTIEVYGSKISKVQGFQKVLNLVGSGCGYCFSQGLILPETHIGEECTSMKKAEQKQFKELKRSVTYGPSGSGSSSRKIGSACWRCHVNSMGHNALHPEMVRGMKTCKNSNMMFRVDRTS